MKVEVFAAQIHVEDLVVAYIEQNLTMYNINWGEMVMKRYKIKEMEEHNVLEMAALTLEDLVVAHIEQSLPMCNAKLE